MNKIETSNNNLIRGVSKHTDSPIALRQETNKKNSILDQKFFDAKQIEMKDTVKALRSLSQYLNLDLNVDIDLLGSEPLITIRNNNNNLIKTIDYQQIKNFKNHGSFFSQRI